MRLCKASISTLLGATILAVPAYAQALHEQPDTSANAAVDNSGVGLSDIVVTARRRAEPLQATPLAVSAVDSARLQEARVTNISDLTTLTPSITLARNSTNPTSLFPFIRGFGTKSTDPATEPPIAITIDGIYQAQLIGAFVNLFDVEAVEVLRGPQGTLLGKNSPSGGVSIRTRRPGTEFGGMVQIDYGSWENVQLRGNVDVPLIADKLFATVSAYRETSDGYVRNIVTGKRLAGIDIQSYRLGVLANINDDVSWYVSTQLDFDKGEDAGDRNISSTAPLVIPTAAYPVTPPPLSLTCTRPYSAGLCGVSLPNNRHHTTQALAGEDRDSRNFAITSNLDIDTGPVNFAVVTGYRNFREKAFADIDGTQLSIIDSRFSGHYRQFSQEMRVASSDGGGLDMDGKLNWLLGIYYFNYQYDRYGRSLNLGSSNTTYQEGNTNSYALFAHAEYDLLDNLNLSVGGRQTWDHKTHLSRAQRFFLGLDPEFTQRVSWNNFSYDVTLNYDLSRSNMVYVRYATGYRGGGFTGVPATAAAVSIADPEKVKGWEFGSKNDFFDHRLRLNVSLFHNKFDNLQRVITEASTAPPFFVQKLRNIARAKTQGIEVEALVRPIPELTLRGNVGYLDAKYTDFIANLTGVIANGETNNTGLRFPYTSKWTVQVGGSYKANLGSAGSLTFNADYSYRSRYNTTDLNYAFGEQKGLGLLSASLTWNDPDGRFTLSVYGKNLTDRFYIDGGDAIGGLSTYVSDGPPRQWGVSAGMKF